MLSSIQTSAYLLQTSSNFDLSLVFTPILLLSVARCHSTYHSGAAEFRMFVFLSGACNTFENYQVWSDLSKVEMYCYVLHKRSLSIGGQSVWEQSEPALNSDLDPNQDYGFGSTKLGGFWKGKRMSAKTTPRHLWLRNIPDGREVMWVD